MKKYLLPIFFGVFIIYFPSFFTFFTNDDFFHLKLSQAHSFDEFINFFNFKNQPLNFGSYRPLTTQVYYYLDREFFLLNPIPLHVISFVVFCIGVFLLFKLILILTKDEGVAGICAIFYSFSAIHFGHMYFLGTFQELGLFVFYIFTALSFLRYLIDGKLRDYVFSILGFVFSLLSKETAVTIPGVLLLVHLFRRLSGHKILTFNKTLIVLIPFFVVLVFYLYFHIFVYGIATGDSYFTDYSLKKTLNSLFWYGIWTLGIPEMFVDFFGSGLSINPNLFKFWGREAHQILTLFGVFLTTSFFLVFKAIKNGKKNEIFALFLFSALWFIGTLAPVIFFPFHKFTYNLTLPSIGLFLFLAYISVNSKSGKYIIYFYIALFIILNTETLFLTRKTHWITRGSETAQRVNKYFMENSERLGGKTIVFYDKPQDSSLPWSPTGLVKSVLSDTNFFDVFYPDKFNIIYDKVEGQKNVEYIPSRIFLGY